MEKYKIGITWIMEKTTLIEAESIEEAGGKALKYEAHAPGNAIQGFYVKNSLKVESIELLKE